MIRSATQVTPYTVPTAAELAGDFSDPRLPKIYDPTTGTAISVQRSAQRHLSEPP